MIQVANKQTARGTSRTLKPVLRSSISKKGRRKKLPPGQRLILYGLLAWGGILLQGQSQPAGVPTQASVVTQPNLIQASPFKLEVRREGLESAIKIASSLPKLSAGVFAVNPASGAYVDVDGQKSMSSASMIKIPVLVAMLTAIDKQDLKFNQTITLKPELMGGGSGYLQWRPVGSKLSLQEVATLMIKISDNTATNHVIDALGGMDVVNQEFEQWGLRNTRVHNWLPDLDGTNTTSPYDLSLLLGRIDRGELISPSSREFMYDVMKHVKTRTLLPPGLGPGATIVHKTGDIGSMVGDAGIVTATNGQRYIVAVQVARPRNDQRANQLIRDLSRLIYVDMTGDNTPVPKPVVLRSSHSHHRRHHRHHLQGRLQPPVF